MDDGLLRKDVEVLYGMIEDDACHSDSSQGIGHVNACIGEKTGFVHILLFLIAKVQKTIQYAKFLGYSV